MTFPDGLAQPVHIVHAERIRALEVQVDDISNDIKSMDGKLDELLALRARGAGAFWLATTVLGAGIIGFFTNLYEWIKGVSH